MRPGRLEITGGAVETGWWGRAPADAPTLVLLHEGLGSVGLWRDVPNRLAEATGWGVFAYSRFGYGGSGSTPLPRPMSYLHDEALVVLPEVLQVSGIERTVLIGHSDGGSIATIYAGSTQAPKPVVVGVVTIAAHFVVEDLNISSIHQIKADYEAGDLRDRLGRHHRDVDTAFRGWNDAWLDPRFRDFDITSFLPGIQVPVLALQGADDPYGTDIQLRIVEERVKTPLTTQMIKGAKHSPHLEATDQTLAAIVSFIANLPRGSST